MYFTSVVTFWTASFRGSEVSRDQADKFASYDLVQCRMRILEMTTVFAVRMPTTLRAYNHPPSQFPPTWKDLDALLRPRCRVVIFHMF